jgi:hypothetical protein
MATSSKIRVGIVGVSPNRGFASIAHLPALQALSDFEISAVCTTRQDSADAAAKHYVTGHSTKDKSAHHNSRRASRVRCRERFPTSSTVNVSAGEVEITEVAQAVSEDGALVSMMLSNSEKLIVAGLQGRARDEAPFRYWTRKEAALKATGPSRIAMGAARLLIIYSSVEPSGGGFGVSPSNRGKYGQEKEPQALIDGVGQSAVDEHRCLFEIR